MRRIDMKKEAPKKRAPKTVLKAKKRQNSAYEVKTTNRMRVLRIILWCILAFIFIRGLITCLRPNKLTQLDKMISDFKTEFYNTQDTDYELLAFARNFITEYLTYDVDGKESFMNRIRPYVSDNISHIEEIYDFKNTCETSHVEAYKIEKVSASQADVFVKAKIKYTIQEENKDGEIVNTSIKVKDTMLRVPVHIGKGYIVEDLPVYISDSMLDKNYKTDGIEGEEINAAPYTEAVQNFLKAYYGADQSVLDYFVSTKADSTKFRCLGGMFDFSTLDNIAAYKRHNEILCTVSYKIIDSINHTALTQQMNITLVNSGKRLYVRDYGTKTFNI